MKYEDLKSYLEIGMKVRVIKIIAGKTYGGNCEKCNFDYRYQNSLENKVGIITSSNSLKIQCEHDNYLIYPEFCEELEILDWNGFNPLVFATEAYITKSYYHEPLAQERKKTMLQKVTDALKRALSSALQTQYKAGYINGGLELTPEGVNALMSILADKFSEDLTKSAESYIAEVEKEKK